MGSTSELEKQSKIMVFRPTFEEFKNFSKYIAYMEEQGAHKFGIAKVVAPPEWKPRNRSYEEPNFIIDAPVSQSIVGQQGVYQQLNVLQHPMTLEDFEKIAFSERHLTPVYDDFLDLERRYWKNLPFVPAMYGADIPGSLTDPDVKEFNVAKLGTILDMIQDDKNIKIEGVNTPYLYFGMWKATFPWHTEDMDLYSINYLHYGAPKFWYSIAPEEGERMEQIAKEYFQESARTCSAFLRHKMTIISPTILERRKIRVNKMIQHEREFIITFPYAYHAGFNTGFNCAESTNFASERWIEFGLKAELCLCTRDSVRIDMTIFAKHFLPEEHQAWREGRENGTCRSNFATFALARRKNAARNGGATSGKATTAVSHSTPHQSATLNAGGCVGSSTSSPSTPDLYCHCSTSSRTTCKRVYQNVSGLESSADSDPGEDICLKCGRMTPTPTTSTDDSPVAQQDLQQPSTSRSKGQTTLVSLKAHAPPPPPKSDQAREVCPKKFQRTFEVNPETLSGMVTVFDQCIKNLWQFKMFDATVEERFNKDRALRDPHCCVCQYFVPKPLFDRTERLEEVPEASRRIVTDACFDRSPKSGVVSSPSKPKDVVLVCKSCSIAVHPSCYGVTFPETITPLDKLIFRRNFLCERCKARDLYAECRLCCLRGGALFPTKKNDWCHVICALLVSNARFSTKEHRRFPVSIDETNLSTMCYYCRNRTGGVVVCSVADCDRGFHVTCGFEAGCTFGIRDWPIFLTATCTRHDGSETQCLSPISAGMVVYAARQSQPKESEKELGKVMRVAEETFCVVDFDDGSFSNDLYPSDIVSCSCLDCQGIHLSGSRIEVKWVDGNTYYGNFRRAYKTMAYAVMFEESGEVNVCTREEIDTVDEYKRAKALSVKKTK